MPPFSGVSGLGLRSSGGFMACWGSAGKFVDGREHFPPMPEQDADVLEVLIGQMAEYRDIDSVLGKALRILRHAELCEPVRNLLHAAPRLRQ